MLNVNVHDEKFYKVIVKLSGSDDIVTGDLIKENNTKYIMIKSLFIPSTNERKGFVFPKIDMIVDNLSYSFNGPCINLISKPNKYSLKNVANKQSKRNIKRQNILAKGKFVVDGSIISLSNRSRSHLEPVKFLAVSKDDTFICKKEYWEMFTILKTESCRGNIRYNDIVTLKHTKTGKMSPKFIVRKVIDSNLVSIPLSVSHDDEVHQLHKIALEFHPLNGVYNNIEHRCFLSCNDINVHASIPFDCVMEDFVESNAMNTEKLFDVGDLSIWIIVNISI